MAGERDLLEELQAALERADVDVAALVEGAWQDARDDVRATLRRLMARDLLARATGSLQAGQPLAAPPGASGATPSPPPPAGAPAPGDPDGAAATPSTGTYLYGVLGPDVTLPGAELPRLPGGGRPRLLDAGTLRALVCDVEPTTFTPLREPGPDGLDVLAAAAEAHDVVLARFVDAPVLPLPLGTVLPDDAAVTDLLARHAAPLTAELARVTGFAEWAVTVRSLDERAEDDEARRATSGRDYLQGRREALRRREDRWQDQQRLAATVHGPLTACAVEAVEVGSRPLEDAARPLHHGVYLVADDARERFLSTVTYLRGELPDAVIEVTGPWPPYHFTAVDLSAGDEVVEGGAPS